MKRLTVSLACLLSFIIPAAAQSTDIDIDVCSTGVEVQLSAEPLVVSRKLEGIVHSATSGSSLEGGYLTCTSFIKDDSSKAENHHFVCILLEKSNDLLVFGPGSTGDMPTMTVLAGTGKWSGAAGGDLAANTVTAVNVNKRSDTRNTIQGCVNYTGKLDVTQ